nr:hypothetical protein [candidate division Zixibacteria bacterium]
MTQITKNQISPKLPFDFDSYIYNLSTESFYKNNCIKVLHGTGDRIVQSSPFVTALAARILYGFRSHPMKNSILYAVGNYLKATMDDLGLIGFLDPNNHRFDLDTIACVHGIIHEFNPDDNASMIPGIVEIMECHRDRKTGAFYTWIDKPKNNIDFIVNINIGLFFEIIGHSDCRLINYLAENYGKFLRAGSHYYHNIGFPLYMMSIYKRRLEEKDRRSSFQTVIENLLNHVLARNVLQGWIGSLNSSITDLANPHWPGIACFNSRDGVYHSRILTDLALAETSLLSS